MRVLALVVAAIVTLGLGSCDREQRDSETLSVSDIGWADEQGFADNPQAVRGARIFAQVGCLNCHTYLGDGTQNLGAPDLTAIGRETREAPSSTRPISATRRSSATRSCHGSRTSVGATFSLSEPSSRLRRASASYSS
jgi:hypothetical protein